jgi:hypothetical protein
MLYTVDSAPDAIGHPVSRDRTVDAHVHLLPSRLTAAVRRFFDSRGIDSGRFAYPPEHVAVCDLLAAEGVAEAWSLPYARRPGAAAELNQASARLAARQGLAISVVGGCTVHPGDERPAAIVRHAVEDLGLRVLKLHCSVGDFTPDDPRLDEVWEYVSQVCLPAVVHAGHAHDGSTAGAELGPVGIVASRHPGARIVIAHCGYAATAEALQLVAAHPGLYADLTPVIHDPVQPPAGRLEELAAKLLFGSDAPNTGMTVTQLLAGLAETRLSAPAWQAITGGTARRLQQDVKA